MAHATMEIAGLLSVIASNHLPGNGSMSDRLKSALCEDALKMAIRNRRPSPGLIVHTPSHGLQANHCRAMDRGVQYACDSYRKLLGLHKLKASPLVHVNMHCRAMNEPQGELPRVQAGPRKRIKWSGEPFEGAERSNGELLQFTEDRNGSSNDVPNATRREAKAAFACSLGRIAVTGSLKYIEIFDNRQRRHSSIGYRTPEQARMDMTTKMAAQSNKPLVRDPGARSVLRYVMGQDRRILFSAPFTVE